MKNAKASEAFVQFLTRTYTLNLEVINKIQLAAIQLFSLYGEELCCKGQKPNEK